jgi:hypothetical protein
MAGTGWALEERIDSSSVRERTNFAASWKEMAIAAGVNFSIAVSRVSMITVDNCASMTSFNFIYLLPV